MNANCNYSKDSILSFKLILSILIFILFSSVGIAQLSGPYTVGTGGDYVTLQAAANDLMSQGVSGPVTMNILSGTYNEHFEINGITGTSAVNTVTFQSAVGNRDSVWITYNASSTDSNYVVKLDNVQYLTFSNITFHGAGQYHCRIFHINATATATGNITINNNIFHGDSVLSNGYDRIVIYSIDPDIENIHILGNTFYGGSSAIFFQGHNYNLIPGINIMSNTFVSVVFAGIHISYVDSPVLTNNNIESNQYGIRALSGMGNIQIHDNRIIAGHTGIYIGNFDASGGDRSLIVNNFVSVTGRHGISIGNSVNMDVYHNSVYVLDPYQDTRAFELLSNSVVPVINIINNSFACREGGYAYYITHPSAVGTSDYNNLYTAGNYIAFRDSNIIDLNKLQNVSGNNLNSLSVFPHYNTDTDLHTIAPWLDNKGTNLNTITRDIDGENRDPATPDIGADEFTSNPNSTPYFQDLTIGSGGDFTTINEAIDSLILRGVTDSIHINIMPGTYIEQVDLISIPGTNANRLVTFQSQTNDTAEIRFNSIDQYSNYTIRLKGADDIRFRNLKLRATGANYSIVLDYYRGANNTIVENCALTGMSGSGAVASKNIIFSEDSYYENRVIRNNILNEGTYGIFMRRNNNNYDHPKNPTIENNTIINNGYCGIFLQYTDFFEITSNTIQAENVGIFLSYCNNQSYIRKNKINVNSQYGLYVSNCVSAPGGQPIRIFNNFIHVGGVGDAYGIYIINSNSLFIFHNSVNITSTDITDGRAFHLPSGTSTAITVNNNIFKNSGGGYAFYVGNIGSIGTCDYNDFYTTGARLAYWAGDITDLAQLQASSGQNFNSISGDPLFVSDTDLHTTAAILDSAASYQGVDEDIDGQLRDQSFPDIGADEFGYFGNRDPIITSSPIIIARVDSLYEYQVTAFDPDGDPLHFSITTAPNFIAIDSLSGLINGNPTVNDVGQYNIQIEVRDTRGGNTFQEYTLHVISLPLFTVSFVSSSLHDTHKGDVSWGDYDNDGDLDIALLGSGFAAVYRNDSGVFTDIQANLHPVGVYGDVAWGDYDNDGDLDLAVAGVGYNHYGTTIYRNDAGQFVDINPGLEQVDWAAIAWGDYDNDGDMDIALTGGPYGWEGVFKIYNNQNGIFTELNQALLGLVMGSLEWGDYDNDGDMDLLCTGHDELVNDRPWSGIYRNDNGIFTSITLSFRISRGCAKWGDYDNDGYLDILYTGEMILFGNRNYASGILKNNGDGTFSASGSNLQRLRESSADWGDYDNDGDLDLIIAGECYGRHSIVYRNDNGDFVDINTGLEPMDYCAVDWGDYDNDGDLDILMTGSIASGPYPTNPLTCIYDNNLNAINTPPSVPQNTLLQFIGNECLLTWETSTDPETPQAGLTYNLRIGTTPGGSEIKSALSNDNGYRQIPEMGNTNHLTLWQLNYIPSNMFWSVQAVDHGFASSPFSVEDTMTLSGIIRNVIDVPNDQGGKVSIRWQASELDTHVDSLIYYSIWRAIPPTKNILGKNIENYRATLLKNKTYYWERIDNVQTHRLPFYSYTCPTLCDSIGTNNGMHYFMISAHTNIPNVFFDSAPDSGYSMDNIAPNAPANLNGNYNNNQIALHWNPNNENDLKEYVLYKSLTPNINPATDSVFATTTDTNFVDLNLSPGNDYYYIVCAKDIHDNLSSASNEVEIILSGILQDGTEIPKTYALYQNYPNPFNPYTLIKFDLPKASKVRVNIFNSLGENVATLVNETMSPGKYQYIWKPKNLSSGLYFYTIQAEDFRSVKKMLLVK